MAAYVASARIDRGRPRIASPARPSAVPAQRDAAGEPAWLELPHGQRDVELRWEALRERWAQLTFFLFDPESWR